MTINSDLFDFCRSFGLKSLVGCLLVTSIVTGCTDGNEEFIGQDPLDNGSVTSKVALIRFEFAQIGGRPDHEGLVPIQGSPLVGEQVVANARLSSSVHEARMRIMNKSGNNIISDTLLTDDINEIAPGYFPEIPPSSYGQTDYMANLQIPDQKFSVQVVGKDSAGNLFELPVAGIFKPSRIKVEFDPVPFAIYPGVHNRFELKISNYDVVGRVFTAQATDEEGFLITPIDIGPSLIEAGISRVFVFDIFPGINVDIYTPDTLSVVVKTDDGMFSETLEAFLSVEDPNLR